MRSQGKCAKCPSPSVSISKFTHLLFWTWSNHLKESVKNLLKITRGLLRNNKRVELISKKKRDRETTSEGTRSCRQNNNQTRSLSHKRTEEEEDCLSPFFLNKLTAALCNISAELIYHFKLRLWSLYRHVQSAPTDQLPIIIGQYSVTDDQLVVSKKGQSDSAKLQFIIF